MFQQSPYNNSEPKNITNQRLLGLLQDDLCTVHRDVDIARICGGRDRERGKKTANVGRIRKIVYCMQILFGLPYNCKPNLSMKMTEKPFEPSRSVSMMSVA